MKIVTPDQITTCRLWIAASDVVPAASQTGQVSSIVDNIANETLTNTLGSPLLVRSDGLPALRFDGATMGMSSSTLSIANATTVVLAVVKWRGGYSQNGFPFGMNSNQAGAGGALNIGACYQYYFNGSGGLLGSPTDQNTRVPKERHLVGSITSGGSTNIQVNGLRGASFTNSASGNSAGVCLGYNPGLNSQYYWAGDFFEGLVLSNPTAADLRNAINYLNWSNNLPVAPPTLEYPLIIVDGNSVSEGWLCSSTRTTWWANALRYLNTPCEMRVVAKGGNSTPNVLALLPRDVYPLYDEKRRITVYLCWEVINDIVAGSTAAQAWANTIAVYQAVRTNMPKAVLVIPTIQPAAEVASYSTIAAYNALVYANWAQYADLLWDIASNPTVGKQGQNVAPLYDSGGTHLADPGSIIFGQSFASVLNASAVVEGAASNQPSFVLATPSGTLLQT